MIRVKVCGLTTVDNALACAEAGADMLGLNFYPPSPRSLSPDMARQITDVLRAELGGRCPVLVGVFVNERARDVQRIVHAAGLDAAQLSGDEDAGTVAALGGQAIKAIRPRSQGEAVVLTEAFLPHASTDPRLPSLLLDAYHKALYGGTGEQASIEAALSVRDRVPRMMLAGGLNPENVGARARAIQPWGVDVASGVESGQPGIKDIDKVRAFIAAVRNGA
jgi:phosphoribosylanthranilate isomerase